MLSVLATAKAMMQPTDPPMGRSTLFLSIPYAMSARNILRSQAYSIAREHFRLVVVSPLASDPAFVEEFKGSDIHFEPLPKDFGWLFKGFRYFLDILEGYHFTRRIGNETVRILEAELRHESPLTYCCRRALGSIFGRSIAVLEWLRQRQESFIPIGYYERLFSKYQPCAVFLTHPLALEEFPLAFAARRRGVRVAAIVHSWDNLSSKSGMKTALSPRPGRMLPIKFDRMVVWNDGLRRELEAYYGYDQRQVLVSGIPQFDAYVSTNGFARHEFLRNLGMDPDKKLIFYACASPLILPEQQDILDLLVAALREGRFCKSSQLLIRSHPRTDMQAWQRRYCGFPDVFFETAGVDSAASRVERGWKNDDSSRNHLAQVLRCSDVTINVFSTMTLDAAMLDRPVVCVCFDGKRTKPYLRSVRRFYDFTHYKPILESGGVRLASAPEELLAHIDAYLADPALDAGGRRRIRETQCQFVDGRAGERIGRFLRELTEPA